jgi:hypothetical protein
MTACLNSSVLKCRTAQGAALLACLLLSQVAHSQTQSAPGPLRVSQANPRYFADGSGKLIYLTGSHTWNNLQDMGPTDPPAAFEYGGYLDFLEKHHHNFIRLWRWELVSWNTAAANEKEGRTHFCSPHPWARSGPENALDGRPKFDLGTFDTGYFQRLRSRVEQAGRRGIYVSIMLFEGWGLQFVKDGWQAHPFHPANNSSRIGAAIDPGKGLAIFTLAHPEITRVQEAYVRKVIDTVNDLDNVLFEISNENHPPSTDWQHHFIRFIHQYEKTKPKQHPVGMTFQYEGGKNATLLASPAEWISPNPDADAGYDYRNNPPPADGRKVVLSDTDHLWGIGGDVPWVWKSFLRGLNPLFMDPYKGEILSPGSDAKWEPVRVALGQTRRLAERINLASMKPVPQLASTGYCLAKAGEEYLVFQPKPGESFSVELTAGRYQLQWFNLTQFGVAGEDRMDVAGGKREFKAPFNGMAILHLRVP